MNLMKCPEDDCKIYLAYIYTFE